MSRFQEGIWPKKVTLSLTTATIGWTLDSPDGYRGAPFRRWLSTPEFAIDGITEIVDVPTDIKDQSHIRRIWERGYPELYAWFRSKETKPYRWGHILFRKADW